MKSKMHRIEIKPFIIGLLLFMILDGAYLTLLAFASGAPEIITWLPYVTALVFGGITGYLSSFKPLLSGAILGIFLSLSLGLSNYVWCAFGMPADFSGFYGSVSIATILFPFMVALSALGGGVGGWIKQHKKAS
jgi:hypothetical protein